MVVSHQAVLHSGGHREESGSIWISGISKPVTFGKPLCRYIKSEEHRQLKTYGKHRKDFELFDVWIFFFFPFASS